MLESCVTLVIGVAQSRSVCAPIFRTNGPGVHVGTYPSFRVCRALPCSLIYSLSVVCAPACVLDVATTIRGLLLIPAAHYGQRAHDCLVLVANDWPVPLVVSFRSPFAHAASRHLGSRRHRLGAGARTSRPAHRGSAGARGVRSPGGGAGPAAGGPPTRARRDMREGRCAPPAARGRPMRTGRGASR